MTILLIRHGETAANAARIVQLPEEPLSKRGLGQAARVARRIEQNALPVLRILSSDLERARSTAAAIGAVTGAAVDTEPLLQERNFGDLRGRAYADLGLDPMADNYHPPAGESWEQFHQRAARAWQQVESAALALGNKGCLVVVTHGLVCRSFAEHHLTLEPATPPPIRWGNTSLTEIEHEAPWRVSVLNCTLHLQGHLEGDFADATADPSGL
jgi:probable phosphoglycerate mutase